MTNGKNVMLAFGASLNADDISDVAAYVESQSVKGWALAFRSFIVLGQAGLPCLPPFLCTSPTDSGLWRG